MRASCCTLLVLAQTARALLRPSCRVPRAPPSRAVKSALLSDYVLDLERRCGAGDGDACDAIAQLDTFAKSLEERRDRRKKAAELLRAAGPPTIATAPATPAPASAENFAPTPKPDSVEAALIRLFDSYDQTKSGAVALDAFTSRWVSERMRTVSRENDLTGTERTWEARQARAGARRITRVFGKKGGRMTQREFVEAFAADYGRRIARGLPPSRAVAEILTNMPQRALFQEMYGSE